MQDTSAQAPFATLNKGYNAVFRPGHLTIGLVAPLESYPATVVPTLEHHLEHAALADTLGFAALWLRDVPFNVPAFGDAGQIFDPFVYLGLLAGATRSIALGTASVILPLRHPAHVAKAAASADVLSGGRLLLGVASGDRPEEYPAMNMDFENRGTRFRDSVDYIRAMGQDYPQAQTDHGTLSGGIDMLPKPTAARLPLLITGGSRQHPDWVAANGDGWITYPRDAASQARVVNDYRARVASAGGPDKPVMQSLYIDLLDDPKAAPCPIHLGFSSGIDFLKRYLTDLQSLGVNHVALNLRFNSADIAPTLERIAQGLFTDFPYLQGHSS